MSILCSYPFTLIEGHLKKGWMGKVINRVAKIEIRRIIKIRERRMGEREIKMG